MKLRNPTEKCVCSQCQKEYLAEKWQVKNGRKFCSKKCSGLFKRKPVERVCEECLLPFQTLQKNVNRGKARFCSCGCALAFRRKSGKVGGFSIGEKNINWKGGVTKSFEQQELRQDGRVRIWRDLVYRRDRYTCQKCGDNRGHNLNAHHIFAWAKYPNLRYSLENGTTLCIDCHKEWHKIMKKDSFWDKV